MCGAGAGGGVRLCKPVVDGGVIGVGVVCVDTAVVAAVVVVVAAGVVVVAAGVVALATSRNCTALVAEPAGAGAAGCCDAIGVLLVLVGVTTFAGSACSFLSSSVRSGTGISLFSVVKEASPRVPRTEVRSKI